MEKRIVLTLPGLELRPMVVQPVGSRYTDYATAARTRIKHILCLHFLLKLMFPPGIEAGTLRVFLGSNVRPVPEIDNVTAIYKPIV
jgi:hypothetical protein